MTSATAMLVAEPWRCLWGFSPRLNVTCNFFSQNLWGKSANAAPFLVKKQKCQFDENKIDKKKPCLAPYRNSCKEISPSPSSIMLNLKKFHSQLHTPSWVDGTEKPNKEPNLCEKLLWQRVQSLKSIRCLGNHLSQEWWRNPPIFTFENKKSSSKLPAKKISVFNGSPRGSSTQCPTDSPNHDSRAPKWPTNFAASGCSIQH